MAKGKKAAVHPHGVFGQKKRKVVESKENGRQLFMKKQQAVEPDSVGRKFRPTAHGPRQAAIAKRARRTVRKLSDQVI